MVNTTGGTGDNHGSYEPCFDSLQSSSMVAVSVKQLISSRDEMTKQITNHHKGGGGKGGSPSTCWGGWLPPQQPLVNH